MKVLNPWEEASDLTVKKKAFIQNSVTPKPGMILSTITRNHAPFRRLPEMFTQKGVVAAHAGTEGNVTPEKGETLMLGDNTDTASRGQKRPKGATCQGDFKSRISVRRRGDPGS